MGMRGVFKLVAETKRFGGQPTRPLESRGAMRSPWSSSRLAQIAWSDIFGTENTPVTRAEADKVGALVKGRSLITGTLSRQPLAKFRGETKVAPDPWMFRTNTREPPQERMAWTIDDLIYGGSSLWAVERGAGGRITDAIRVHPDDWEVTADLKILVNGISFPEDEVILFNGPQAGLLDIAADDIRAAIAMKRAWAQRVDTPVPLVALKQVDDIEQTDDEIQELVDTWDEARRAGGTAFVPKGLDVEAMGTTPTDLFVEGRNASRLDIANYLSLPAALLEGSTATASLTYSTKETSRNELVDLSLAYWATPIEARLSQDDVVPRGQRVAFDLEYLSTPTQPAQGPASED